MQSTDDGQPGEMVQASATTEGATIILLRTHFVDDLVTNFARRLETETGWRVCLMLDAARVQVAEVDGFDSIALTPSLLGELGLLVTHDVLWRCGDYALYAALRRYPDSACFWMVEPDVRINLKDLGDFFHLFARHPEYDLLATHLGAADDSYPWTAMMRPFAPHPWKCMFPVVRLSARALRHLLGQRRLLGQRFASERQADGTVRSQDLFPNDEVFVATALHEGGFRCADLNDTGIEFYNSETFSFAFPMPDLRLRNLRPDGKIYHPVDAGPEYMRKLRGRFEHVRNNGGPVELIRSLFDRPQLIADIRLECGTGAADRFAADVAAAIQALTPAHGIATES